MGSGIGCALFNDQASASDKAWAVASDVFRGAAIAGAGFTARAAAKGIGKAISRARAPKSVSEKVLNRANHVFGKKSLEKHNLGGFLAKFSGDQVKAFHSLEKAVQKLANQKKIEGIFKDVVVRVKGVDVTIRGRVIDGTVNISTAFIP